MKTKRILSLALVLCLLLCLAPAAAMAEDDAQPEQAAPPADETQDVADGYYLVGSMNNWTPAAAYQFAPNPGNPSEYMLSTTLTANAELKVVQVSGGSIATWYPGGNNYVVDAAHAGSVNIYFQPDYKGDWAAFGGYFYIEVTSSGYAITFDQPAHATLSADYTRAESGTKVTVTVDLEDGYVVSQMKPFNTYFAKVNDSTYTFTMPSRDITITAVVYVGDGFYYAAGRNVADVETSQRFTEQVTEHGDYVYDTVLTEGDSISVYFITTEGSWAWTPPKTSPTVSAEQAGPARIYLSETERDGYVLVTQYYKYIQGVKTLVKEAWLAVKNLRAITVQTDENGTVTPSVTEAVEGDTVRLTVTPEEGYELDTLTVVDANGNEIAVEENSFSMPDCAVTVTATFKKVPAEEYAEVYGASISLRGNIGLNYYVYLPDSLLADEGAYVTLDDTRVLISQVEGTAYNGRTLYPFTAEVPAKEMTRKVTLKVYNGQNQAVTLKLHDEDITEAGFPFSVRDYLDLSIDSDSTPENLKNLCIAMRDYGSCAQVVFDYDVANRAAITGDPGSVTPEDLAAYAPEKAIADNSPVAYYGSSVILDSETAIRHYFRLTGGSIEDYSFTVNGETVTPTQNGNYWVVEIKDIVAKDLDESYPVVVSANGEELISLEYSALSYAYLAVNNSGSDADLVLQAKALFLYWQAAETYFAG